MSRLALGSFIFQPSSHVLVECSRLQRYHAILDIVGSLGSQFATPGERHGMR